MITFIVNPASGNGKPQAAIPVIRQMAEEAGVDYIITQTQYPADATDIAKAAAKGGASCVVAVGGDGTVQEAASSLLRTGVPMGVVPLGNGNDFIHGLNKQRGVTPPKDPAEAVRFYMRRILRGTPEPIDAIHMGGFVSLNIASVGLDAEIVRGAARHKQRFGKSAYIVSTVQTVLNFSPFAGRIICDGAPIDGQYTLAAVCNGQYYGGGYRIAPMADMADGLLTVCLVRKMPRAALMALFPSVLAGRHTGLSCFSHVHCKTVEICFDGDMTVNLDGNLFPLKSPLAFEVARQGILVY